MSEQRITLPAVDAPAPMEIFEVEKIHPYNQELVDELLKRFRPLSWHERRRLQKRLKRLHRQLTRARYNELVNKRHQLEQMVLEVHEQYKALRDQLLALPEEDRKKPIPVPHDGTIDIRHKLKLLQAEGKALCKRGREVKEQLAPLRPLFDEFMEAYRKLERHYESLNEQAKQRQDEKRLRQETRIIESIFLDTFARTTGCHWIWYDARGRRRCDVPRFQRIGIDADSHWFLLETSYKGWFGWRSSLPYGVNVANLVDAKTIENLSAACGRQVEVIRSEAGTQIYFRVNRLDSPDGLPSFIAYKAILELYPEENHELIPFPVGVFSARRVKWFNLKTDPHILVAGQTRAGKSNYLNTVISTWIQAHSPDELRLVLIDNKGGVEFSHYHGVPHVLGIVTELEGVLPKLEEMHSLMRSRLHKLADRAKKDIYAYNASVDPEERLPHIVVFVDEMQTLLNQGQWTRDVHHLLAVIGSQGAAAGIHLVLCTQHPSKESIPMTIKTNMGCRIVLKMPSGYASMTILDSMMAADLPKDTKGRVVVSSGTEMEQAQTAFISDEDVAESVRFSIRKFGNTSPPLREKFTETEEEDTSPVEAVSSPAEVETVSPAPITKAPIKLGFDEQDLIAIALDHFDGGLKADRIYETIKRQNVATIRQVREMVQEIVARGSVEYMGVRYETIRQGRFYRLDPVEDDETTIRQYDAVSA